MPIIGLPRRLRTFDLRSEEAVSPLQPSLSPSAVSPEQPLSFSPSAVSPEQPLSVLSEVSPEQALLCVSDVSPPQSLS